MLDFQPANTKAHDEAEEENKRNFRLEIEKKQY